LSPPAELRDRTGTERPARILLVDDDGDTREMLAVVLAREGWEVRQADDVGAGLRHLREGGFDVLITDYELPDGTGGQLLMDAARERLLRHCAVLVLTGHPDPADVGGVPVIRKPFDPDALRKQVRGILARPPASPMPEETASAAIELVLYVARESPASRLAERNVRKILERSPPGTARLEVRDVAEHPAEAEEDRILFVPTLVARCAPPVWMVGNLRDPAALLGVLALCGAGGGTPAP
jgi:DNA-binding response OmpR family regulator